MTETQRPNEPRTGPACDWVGQAGEHFKQSSIEFLKGIRELLDHQINRMSATPHKGTRIDVE